MFVLGIDIGKAELVVCLQSTANAGAVQPLPQSLSVSNTSQGLAKLTRWLYRQNLAPAEIQVVMEATNVYWEECAHYFHAMGCSVSVVNPAQIKFFARSTLRRGKTDAMDAEIIARFGLMMQPEPWTPPQRTFVELKQLVREREAVGRQLTRDRNHLKALQASHHAAPLARRLGQQRIKLLERQLNSLETAIKDLVQQDAILQGQLELLMSVPGFGFIAAVTIIAETDAFATLQAGHQISAYAGLAPAPHQSGLSIRKGSISKVGNARLRRIAYLAALGATLSNSPFKTYYAQLRARGKPPKVALVALARKLLRVGLAVVKSGQPYQPNYQRPVTANATA